MNFKLKYFEFIIFRGMPFFVDFLDSTKPQN